MQSEQPGRACAAEAFLQVPTMPVPRPPASQCAAAPAPARGAHSRTRQPPAVNTPRPSPRRGGHGGVPVTVGPGPGLGELLRLGRLARAVTSSLGRLRLSRDARVLSSKSRQRRPGPPCRGARLGCAPPPRADRDMRHGHGHSGRAGADSDSDSDAGTVTVTVTRTRDVPGLRVSQQRREGLVAVTSVRRDCHSLPWQDVDSDSRASLSGDLCGKLRGQLGSCSIERPGAGETETRIERLPR